MARASPGAFAPPSPLPSAVTAMLTTSQAAYGGPELTADPFRFSDRGSGFGWGWNYAGQPSPCLARQRLSVVVLSLVRQDRRNVVVGGRRQMYRIVFPPYGESCTALNLRNVISLPKAADRDEGGDGEAMFSPLCFVYTSVTRAGRAAAHKDVSEV